MDDFGAISQISTDDEAGSVKGTAQGQKRDWLKVFETLPPQMLNAYGPAKFAKMSDANVWKALHQPLKSGAQYMSEMCSKNTDRRGVGLNRMLHAIILFCKHQRDPKVKGHNQTVLKESLCQEVYDEIDRVLPSMEYCLAPKKAYVKTGSAALRASGTMEAAPPTGKSDTELDRHAAVLYDWLDTQKVSRIRMLLHWQSSGGLSFVASVHHRASQCFKYHGGANAEGQPNSPVSLSDFQAAIKARHRVGSSGIEGEGEASATSDFRAL